MAPDAPARSTLMVQRYRADFREMTTNYPTRHCALFGGRIFGYCSAVYAINEQTRARFFALSLLVHDVDGSLAPAVLPGSFELEFEHALFLHPCPLRKIALWADGDVWMYRYLELNFTDGTVYKIGDS